MSEGKKYQSVVIIGFFIIIFIVLLREYIPERLNYFLIGSVTGWFCSIALFHSLADQERKYRRKRKKTIEEEKESAAKESSKTNRP